MRTNLSNKRNENGITLVALVVTIVVLLILAGVTIVTLFGENGIIKKTQTSADATNRSTIIESARTQIINKQTDNLGSITEKELTDILKNYGTIEDNGETNILEKTLNTNEGGYKIKVNEIWNGTLKVAESKYYIYIDDEKIDIPEELVESGICNNGRSYACIL